MTCFRMHLSSHKLVLSRDSIHRVSIIIEKCYVSFFAIFELTAARRDRQPTKHECVGIAYLQQLRVPIISK